MSLFTIRKWVPNPLSAKLWGNRRKWGLEIDPNDSDWKEWQDTYTECYNVSQREGVGIRVNDAGYKVLNNINLEGKKVLEIGAGDIRHIKYWQGKPAEYILVDISLDMMAKAEESLRDNEVTYKKLLLERNQKLPLENNSVDYIVSFYSLEHLYPISSYLDDLHRVLSPGGKLLGAIPAEGGLAWGSGRLLTSARWFKNNTNINFEKIICWEHPNFADHVIDALDKKFNRKKLLFWPLRIPLVDMNLIVQFIFEK